MTHSATSPQTPTRLTVFGISSARALARRQRELHPETRTIRQREWSYETSSVESHSPSLTANSFTAWLAAHSYATRRTPVPLWYWQHDASAFAAQAHTVLTQLVLPLIQSGAPYCLGFSFPPALMAPQALTLAQRAQLDLEDIRALLTNHQDALSFGGVEGEIAGADTRPRAPRYTRIPARSAAAATLDPDQRRAVEHGEGAARVLAPAGSGKTKTLVARVVELVARGIDPGGILVLAFSSLAAEQLEARLDGHGVHTTRRIAPPGSRTAVHCATFNAFGARYQRDVLGQRIDVDTEGSSSRALMREALAAAGCAPAAVKPLRNSDPVDAFLETLPRVRAGLEDPTSIAVSCVVAGDPPLLLIPFAPVHDHYTRLQSLHRRQSFDDQIYHAVVDLLASPTRRSLLQRRYTHILVDEFQDLNAAQHALVDILSRPRRNLFVVGDDDQLIYGWRFADPRGILGFHDRLPPSPFSRTYLLTTNYRCAQEVVASAARLVAHNTVREEKSIRAAEGAPCGAVHFVAAPDWAARSTALCAFLRTERARLDCGWCDLAVLTRYRSQQFAVALALDAGSVPRPPHFGTRLFTHPRAQRLRAEVAHASSGETAGSAAALLATMLAPLHSTARAGSDDTSAAGNQPPRREPRAANAGLDIADCLRVLADAHPDTAEFLAAWDHLAANEAAAFSPSAAAASTAGNATEPDAVVISTIHAAKGREYRAVAIPDYDCDVSTWDSATIEEERRVVYVAATRAAESLLFTIDSAAPYVHPFLRELVAPPTPDEARRLSAQLATNDINDEARRAHLQRRLAELLILFPELAPELTGTNELRSTYPLR